MQGVELKKILQDEGFILSEIAAKMGESPQNFSSLLSAADVKSSLLERLAVALKKNLYFFYADEKYKSIAPRPDFPSRGDVVSLEKYTDLVRENERLRVELEALREAVPDAVSSGGDSLLTPSRAVNE